MRNDIIVYMYVKKGIFQVGIDQEKIISLPGIELTSFDLLLFLFPFIVLLSPITERRYSLRHKQEFRRRKMGMCLQWLNRKGEVCLPRRPQQSRYSTATEEDASCVANDRRRGGAS